MLIKSSADKANIGSNVYHNGIKKSHRSAPDMHYAVLTVTSQWRIVVAPSP